MVPDELIICPWTTTLAFATDAVAHGVELRLDTRVRRASSGGRGAPSCDTTTGDRSTRAGSSTPPGCGGDESTGCSATSGSRSRRAAASSIVFDKLARRLVDTIVLPVPTARRKGVLVSADASTAT